MLDLSPPPLLFSILTKLTPYNHIKKDSLARILQLFTSHLVYHHFHMHSHSPNTAVHPRLLGTSLQLFLRQLAYLNASLQLSNLGLGHHHILTRLCSLCVQLLKGLGGISISIQFNVTPSTAAYIAHNQLVGLGLRDARR